MNKLLQDEAANCTVPDLELEPVLNKQSGHVADGAKYFGPGNDALDKESMKLISDSDTMTVLQFEPPVMSCNGLASSDMSVSLPNLAGSIEVLQGVCLAGSSNDVRNGSGLVEKRASFSGLSEMQQLKTLSLEDCQACIKNTWNSNGYAKTVCSGSNPSLSRSVCVGAALPQDGKTDELPVMLNATNNRLSAVLENLSLVYLPHTKQLVPAGKNVPDLGSINNNIEAELVRDGPEGAENPTESGPTPSPSKLKHFPRLEAKLDSGPSLMPHHSHDSNSSSSIAEPTNNSALLSQESDISTHSTVILCNHDHDKAQDIHSAQGNFPLHGINDSLGDEADMHSNFLSKADDASFSSVSSLSTATELSISAASISDLEAEKVILDSEDAGFVEISLDARSICEPKLKPMNKSKDIKVEDRLSHPFPAQPTSHPCVNGAKPKRKGLSSFLTRNIFSRKAREASDDPPLGWRLFGKIPPKSPPSRDSGAPGDHQERTDGEPVQTQLNLSCDPRRVKKKDIEAPSTTALILEHRPRGLPSKDREEELRHQQQYEAMIEAAKKKELREAKNRKKQLQQQLKHEDALLAAIKVWNVEVLPNWDNMKNSKKARDLWWCGIPPSVRGKVWKLAFGNDLNLTPELYEICLNRAKDRLKIMKDAGSDTDSISSFSDLPASKEASVELIKLDVSRTFPQLCIFQKGGPYHELLQGLLGAYACYRPDVGYVQGMSFIAAVFLLNMDVDDAFICFSNLLNRPCQIAFFRLDESLMNAYFETYEQFFFENLPRLFNHFKKLSLASNLYIIDWLFTLYAKSLPLDVASRVWDVFCRDGEEFLFRTALGILRLHEDILLNMDFIHLAQFLTRLPDNISSDQLFHALDSINMTIDNRKFTQVLSDIREQNKPES